jgi:hypothetical protein
MPWVGRRVGGSEKHAPRVAHDGDLLCTGPVADRVQVADLRGEPVIVIGRPGGPPKLNSGRTAGAVAKTSQIRNG